MGTNHPIISVTKQIASGGSASALAVTLAQAFQDDPALAWIIPDPEKRKRALPKFFAVTAQQSMRHGEVLSSACDEGSAPKAAALWYPPGHVQDGMWDALRDNLRLLGVFGGNLPRGLKVAEAIYAHHPDPQAYCYLRYVGVAPDAQGKGWGGAIIRSGIARAAEKGLGVLLETATPANVAIYKSLGFETVAEWNVPGGGPKFWTMLRP